LPRKLGIEPGRADSWALETGARYDHLVTGGEFVEVAKRELREIDRRSLFWVGLCVETAIGSGASAGDLAWESFDWPSLRDALNKWLDELPSDTSEVEYRWPASDNLRLCFSARPRTTVGARGYRRMPSFTLADPDPLPPLQFEDGETASIESLPIETVRELAVGSRRLAIELVSHRAAWTTLYEVMSAMGQSNTSEMSSLELEVHAGALGLVEEPPDGLGSFDEGWRDVNRLDVPLFDDPREQDDQ
jgi:hypothetical protein